MLLPRSVAFFMQVVERTYIQEKPIKVSMEPRKVKPQPVYKVEQVELSENIQKFDSKPRYTENEVKTLSERTGATLTATQMITEPLYNRTGKLLGVDSIADWSKNYDKIYKIVEVAKEKLKTDDIEKILPWLYKQVNAAPNITNRKLDDLNVYLILGKEEKPKTKVITKTVVKYIKPKNTVDNFVNNLMNLNIQ